MKKRALLSSAAAPFAHLLGISAARRAEDDEEKKDNDAARADDEDEEKKDDAKAEDGDGDEDDEEKKDAKASDEDEEDDEEEMKASARVRERARCAAIFKSKHAAGRPHIAAELAFNTTLTARQAIGVLASIAAGDAAAPKTRSGGLAAAMATIANPKVGAGDAAPLSPSDPKAVAAQIIAAGKKRRGEA